MALGMELEMELGKKICNFVLCDFQNRNLNT